MSSSSPYAVELQTALHAVHTASLLTKSHLLNHLASSNSSTGVTASTKSDKSEVTVADFASQAVIISIIHAAFPDDDFIAEESGEMLRGDGEEAEELRTRIWRLLQTMGGAGAEAMSNHGSDSDMMSTSLPQSVEEMVEKIDLGQLGGRNQDRKGRTWVLDPIDGTKTYIRGQQYVVCLCLVEHGEQQVAVLGCPNIDLSRRDEVGRVVVEEGNVDLHPKGGWIVSCIKGQGVEVSQIRTPRDLKPVDEVPQWNKAKELDTSTPSTDSSSPAIYPVQFTDSSASPHVSLPLHTSIFETFSPHPPLDIWSMQLKFVLLALRAAGADALIRVPPDPDYHAAVWDHAGGQLLVRESGGLLTDAKGRTMVLDGAMRRLERNWGVCAIRGGWTDGREASEVHETVLRHVRQRLELRDSGK